eukprot:m.44256 g.44256  ORF g.44256 m.44256 type:complete len:187 (+) comp12097_c0_seq1:284-844(+)
MASNVLDYSFSDITEMTDIYDEDPRQGKIKTQMSKPPSRAITTLRLNNNGLTYFTGMTEVLTNIIWDLTAVTMLDVSLNGITTISEELQCLPNLGILYLHGNAISSLKEVLKLTDFPHLKSLSLHGNPIEKENGYRGFVVSVLPALKKFDFSPITDADRERCETWKHVHAPKRLAKTLNPPAIPKE